MNETVQYSLLSRQEWTTLADMDRRAHYLEVALRLFLQHGFNGVSMDHLVAEAGGSKATLYRYFDSKEALFEAIIDDVAAGAVNSAGRDRWDDVELEDGLRQLGRATSRSALDPRTIHMLRLALGEQVRFPELARTLFEHGPRRTYARLREFLAAKVAAGQIDVPDLQIAAEQFLGGIVGHLQLRRALGQTPTDPSQITARVEAGVTTFLAAHRAH